MLPQREETSVAEPARRLRSRQVSCDCKQVEPRSGELDCKPVCRSKHSREREEVRYSSKLPLSLQRADAAGSRTAPARQPRRVERDMRARSGRTHLLPHHHTRRLHLRLSTRSLLSSSVGAVRLSTSSTWLTHLRLFAAVSATETALPRAVAQVLARHHDCHHGLAHE